MSASLSAIIVHPTPSIKVPVQNFLNDDIHQTIQNQVKQLEELRNSIANNFKNRDSNPLENNDDCNLFKAAIAAKITCKERMNELFKLKKDPNKPDKFGILPIHYAAFMGNRKAIKYLLNFNANLLITTDKIGMNILHYAALSTQNILPKIFKLVEKEKDILKALLNAEVLDKITLPPLYQFTSKMTPLEISALLNNSAGINACINAGADPTLINHSLLVQNVSLLMIVMITGKNNKDLKAIECLINAFKKKDKQKSTSAKDTKYTQETPGDKKYSKDSRLLDQYDILERSALHYAVIHEFALGAKLLVKAGAYSHINHRSLNTPLYIALVTKQMAIAELLINQGPKDSRQAEATMLLKPMLALQHEEGFNFCLEHGAWVLRKDHNKKHTYHHVVDCDWVDGFKLLRRAHYDTRHFYSPESDEENFGNLLTYACANFKFKMIHKLVDNLINPFKGLQPTDCVVNLPTYNITTLFEFAVRFDPTLIEKLMRCTNPLNYIAQALKYGITGKYFEGVFILLKTASQYLSDSSFRIILNDIVTIDFKKQANAITEEVLEVISKRNLESLQSLLQNNDFPPTHILIFLKVAINNNFCTALPLLLTALSNHEKTLTLQNLHSYVLPHFTPVTVQVIAKVIKRKIGTQKLNDDAIKALIKEYVIAACVKKLQHLKDEKKGVTENTILNESNEKIALVYEDPENSSNTRPWHTLLTFNPDALENYLTNCDWNHVVLQIQKCLPKKNPKPWKNRKEFYKDIDCTMENEFEKNIRFNNQLLTFMEKKAFLPETLVRLIFKFVSRPLNLFLKPIKLPFISIKFVSEKEHMMLYIKLKRDARILELQQIMQTAKEEQQRAEIEVQRLIDQRRLQMATEMKRIRETIQTDSDIKGLIETNVTEPKTDESVASVAELNRSFLTAYTRHQASLGTEENVSTISNVATFEGNQDNLSTIANDATIDYSLNK